MTAADELRCLRQLLREVAAAVVLGHNFQTDRTTIVLRTLTWDALRAWAQQAPVEEPHHG